jgi:hypothetical protein
LKKYLLINPGLIAGGSNLLLARVMARMHQRHGHALVLVDYENGATRRSWSAAGIPFEFIAYEPGRRHALPDADIVLMGLLGAKAASRGFEVSTRSRLLAWCTAPQDPFKFLPPAYLLNSCGWPAKKAFARWFFPGHRARISRFLSQGSRHGGVIFMDRHCHEVNDDLFGPDIAASIVPICTGIPELAPRLRPAGTGKAYWVGRITDFKTEPFVALTRALLRPGSPVKEVVVIGDGADLASAKDQLAGLAVTWLGYVQPEGLDVELYAQADLAFGHGTALLEAAKLGIPSLLVDGSYEAISPAALRADWLHRHPAGYVGRITSANQLSGREVNQCLAEFSDNGAQIAAADFHRWQSVHHPDAVSDRLAEVIAAGSYTYKDFLETGAAQPGWFGSMIEWTKRNVFRR